MLKEDVTKDYQEKISRIDDDKAKLQKDSIALSKEKASIQSLKQELEVGVKYFILNEILDNKLYKYNTFFPILENESRITSAARRSIRRTIKDQLRKTTPSNGGTKNCCQVSYKYNTNNYNITIYLIII